MMPQQMPDTEVESEQLFPLLYYCIILHNLLSLSLPSPHFQNKRNLLSLDFCCELQFISLQVYLI